jgi:4-amino-4-deoxy-L-arabinose transferase-like glycosyltransferase
MPEISESRPAERESRVWLFVALALTLLIRLWFILGMRGHPFSTVGPQMLDSNYYHRWAIDIISGKFWGSDVFFLRPLYPYLLALAYAVFGQHILAVQFVQTVFATVSCFLLYDTTRRIFGKRSAIFAALGFALTGILVLYTGALLYVEITVLLNLLFLWLILVAGRRTWLWILSGVCFGLLVICRPEMLVAAPFLLWWLSRKSVVDRKMHIVHRSSLVAMTVVALAVIAIVPIRNYIAARDPVLFTAHSGMNFYYGNNPSADGTWQPTKEFEKGGGFSHDRLREISHTIDGKEVKASQASAYWTAQGLRFITHQPGAYLKLLGRKFLFFLSSYEVPNNYYPETVRAASLPLKLAFVSFGLVLAFGLLGMVWAWPKRGQAAPTYLFVAAYLISALLSYVLSRLRAPAIPFLLMFAGFGVSELVEALRRRRVARAVIGVAVALAVYLVSGLIPVKRQSYSAQAWTQTGNIYLEQQDFGKAVDAFNRALVALPSYNYARYSLVLALAGTGQTADAEAELRKIEHATGASTDRKTILSLAAARAAIANSISTASPTWRPARRLADAWVAVADGEYPVAESLYQASLAQDPNDSESSFLLGLVYNRMDSIAKAREWLTRAVALDSANDAARSALRLVDSRLQRSP